MTLPHAIIWPATGAFNTNLLASIDPGSHSGDFAALLEFGVPSAMKDTQYANSSFSSAFCSADNC